MSWITIPNYSWYQGTEGKQMNPSNVKYLDYYQGKSWKLTTKDQKWSSWKYEKKNTQTPSLSRSLTKILVHVWSNVRLILVVFLTYHPDQCYPSNYLTMRFNRINYLTLLFSDQINSTAVGWMHYLTSVLSLNRRSLGKTQACPLLDISGAQSLEVIIMSFLA